MAIFRLDDTLAFPLPELAEESGLLAVGGDLSPGRLLLAYATGIFPWYNEGEPILWYAPPQRMVLPVDELHIGRSLAKAIRRGSFSVTLDTAFEAVIDACANQDRPGQSSTWITTDMRAAYIELHHRGFAHSVESWRGDELVGGLYGVSLGAVFCGESMYAVQDNASKVAFTTLVERLRRWRFHFVDCQVRTSLMSAFGGYEVPRARFEVLLQAALEEPTRHGSWSGEVATV
jgi:leucyl/phenylalanyl-tRNA--protein transferase